MAAIYANLYDELEQQKYYFTTSAILRRCQLHHYLNTTVLALYCYYKTSARLPRHNSTACFLLLSRILKRAGITPILPANFAAVLQIILV